MLYRLCFILTVLLPTCMVSAVLAQGPLLDALKPKEQTVKAEPPEPNVEEKRETAAEKLRVAQRELDSAKAAAPNGARPPEERVQEVDLRDQIERVLAQQQDAQRRKKELEVTFSELERRLSDLRKARSDESLPQSFQLLEEYHDNLNSERTREASVRTTVESAGAALERAKSAAEDKQRLRLAAKDALATNKDQTKSTELTKALATAELESELANELLTLRRMELENEKAAQQNYRLDISFLEERVARLSRTTKLSEQDLQDHIEVLEERSAELKRELILEEPDVAFLENRWFEVRRRADLAPDKSPKLLEEVESHRAAYLAQQQLVAVLNSQIRRLAEMRIAWNRRFKVAHQTATEMDLDKWKEETELAIDQVQSDLRAQSLKSSGVRKRLAELAEKARRERNTDPGLASLIDQQRESLQELSNAYEMNLQNMEGSLQLHEKLLTEIQGDPASSVNGKLASIWDWVLDIWSYPVATVDDRPITMRKIVTGIVFLVIGVFASRWISRMIGHRLLTHVGVHESGAAAIQTITYYTLILFFSLCALHFANVPLTTFTILGGAVALGVGFGSQNIVNNFISGLILLAERPIRIGDLIQVDGLFAVVEKIGARSTRVKTGSSLEIIVPNSKFLENNVTNWTLSDKNVRCELQVGVVYGSPTKQVEELMITAAKLEEMVQVDPHPFVWFREFGDNSLNFQLNFWIQMTSLTKRLTIESNLRFKIDELFREAGIIIAFPQRDIHLDTTRPLDIRVMMPDQGVSAKGDDDQSHAA